MNQQKAIVLIVDDVLTNLAWLSQHLRDANYRVLGAESGMRAIEQVQRLKPDIILLDVLMPGLDGFETCGLLKSNPETQDIPIIFLTALSETVDKVKGFELGGVDYITKPVQGAEVLARLQTHLTIVQLRHQLEEQNQKLELQVAERTGALALANQKLLKVNQELNERNQEFVRSNLTLEMEVLKRKRSEQEKDRLLAMVRQQSDQLTQLTNLLLDAQEALHRGVTKGLHEVVEKNLAYVASNLELIIQYMVAKKGIERFILGHINNSQQILTQTQRYLTSVEWNTQTPKEKLLHSNLLLKLSSREREVLQLIFEGKSCTDIAELLCLTLKTVYTYRSRILKKLNLNEACELIPFAIEYELSNNGYNSI